jgi:hypothetical protein
MSYGVEILAGELPQSYEEALEIRDEVSAAHDELLETADDLGSEEPSPEMRELHRRLTAVFPCICDDSDGPWSDGPLINNFGKHAATLGISFSRVEEVLPFVLSTATEMGFCFALPCRPGSLHRVYALATVALLTKDPARVRQYLAEGEREYCTQADEVCEQFRDFERRVLARLAEIES